MGRGPLSEDTKQARALAKLQEAFGQTITVDELPIETPDERIREAEAVTQYHEGYDFKEKTCRYCNQVFAYRWLSDAISYCSSTCSAAYLDSIGIKWDPTKPPQERWGSKKIPLVVPPAALQILKDQADLEEVQTHDTETANH